MKSKKMLIIMLILTMTIVPFTSYASVSISSDKFSTGEIVPYDQNVPTQIYDLSNNNYTYSFISTNNTTMYTSYRFTGHNGKIAITFNEKSGGSGKYEIALCKLNSLGILTVLSSVELNRGSTIYWPVPSSKVGASEIVFFRFKPLGNGTLSGDGVVSKY